METSATASTPQAGQKDKRKTCPLATALSVLVGLTAFVVIGGWIDQNRAIVQIAPGLAPMQSTTALGFLLFAAALFFTSTALHLEKYYLERYFGGALLVWGLLNVAQYVWSVDLGIDALIGEPFVTDRSPAPGRMSILTSISFLMGGVGVTLAAFRTYNTFVEVLIILLAGLLAGISGSALFSYSAHLPPVVWLGERLSEMAIHTALGFFLLSIALILQRFRCGRAASVNVLRWVWIPAFCGVFFAVFSIYLGLATRAEQNRRELASLEAEALADVIDTRYHELKQALSRMAERVAGLNPDQKEQWLADARHYLNDFEALDYMYVVKPSESLEWRYPEADRDKYESIFQMGDTAMLENDSSELFIAEPEASNHLICLKVFESVGNESVTAEVVMYCVINWQMLVDGTLNKYMDSGIMLQPVVALTEVMEGPDFHTLPPYAAVAYLDSHWRWEVSVDPNLFPFNKRLQNYFLAGGFVFSALVAFLVHSIQLSRSRLKQIQEAQWAQARQKSRLEAFVSHAPAAVAMFDKKMRYIAVSQYWIKDYALEDRDVIGISHYDIFPGMSDDWKAIHARCMQGHVEFNERDCWRPPGWSHDQYLRWEVRPWREPDGAIGGIMMFTSDITADVEREEEINQMRLAADDANRLKSQFLANMSHEIRTPMNGVVGMTSLLTEEPLSKEQKEFVSIIRESADSLLSLIDDILDFSKIEAGKIELEKEEFSLSDLIATTVELLGPMAIRKNNELMAWVDLDGRIELMGDSGRLRQILTNLLGNATKFTEGGEVTLQVIQVASTDETVSLRFEVKDTGIGMTPEQCQKIFQPFVQADGSTSRKFGGTGLGLSISHRLVNVMGGELKVDSKFGVGTTFSFTLTFDLAEDSIGEIKVPAPVETFAGKHCLLVFFSAHSARLVESRLNKWGLTTEVVLSVQDARMVLTGGQSKKPIDLVILDSSLSDNLPMQLTKELGILGMPKESKPTVLLLKSLGMSLTKLQAESVGIDHFIRKPLTPSRIYDALADVYLRSGVEKQFKEAEIDVTRLNKPFSEERILVAEDNAVNRKVITMLLKSMGIQADTVSDGQEAIEAWEQVGYPIVIMDCQMPGMDGFTASRLLRELYHTRQERGEEMQRPYIIALTANAQKGDREKCLLAGMDDYIAKPAHKESLYGALERWQMQNRSTEAS